jgi:hypothetical protein
MTVLLDRPSTSTSCTYFFSVAILRNLWYRCCMTSEFHHGKLPAAEDRDALILVGREAIRRVYKRYQHDPDIDVVLGIARVGLRELVKGRAFVRPPAQSRDPFRLLEPDSSPADDSENT